MSEEKEHWLELENEEAALAALKSHNLGLEIENQLHEYCLLLKEFNSHTNLVSNAELSVLLKEHVLDSLQLLPLLLELQKSEKRSPRLIDIGSGAGFPGMVLAIAAPFLKVTLVDSIGKKCRFLADAAHKLKINDRLEVICERAELLGHASGLRETFDFACARAVGALPLVAELCLPFLRPGGFLLAQRSKRQAEEELQKADALAAKLGARLKDSRFFPPDLKERQLAVLIFEKKSRTGSRFPRSAKELKQSAL
ncbi:MAG: 16S rRNA (guanine(527)-N(7))-methyltransferase RsmG [Candidatus Obscuribacterales bacterium]|nr:16S rRNA (guanine(527)-N(7))-methyltransferase RsmG [Candidatus Obscuribacterales bacterium]